MRLAKQDPGHYEKVKCDNVNQRGGASCPVAHGLKINPAFGELAKSVETISQHQKKMRELALAAAELVDFQGLGNNYMEVGYTDLVCAGQRLGTGHLPENVAAIAGFGGFCPTTQNYISSVKSSPGNPASALSNFDEVIRLAKGTRKAWAKALVRPTEAFPCRPPNMTRGVPRAAPPQTYPKIQSNVTDSEDFIVEALGSKTREGGEPTAGVGTDGLPSTAHRSPKEGGQPNATFGGPNVAALPKKLGPSMPPLPPPRHGKETNSSGAEGGHVSIGLNDGLDRWNSSEALAPFLHGNKSHLNAGRFRARTKGHRGDNRPLVPQK